jgi:hypothetical protein
MTQAEIDTAFADFAYAQRVYMQKLEALVAMAKATLAAQPPKSSPVKEHQQE